MRIAHNLLAVNVLNQSRRNRVKISSQMEKLSSGLRINRESDDAADLSISEKMRAQIRGLNQASRNAQDGISLIQTAEGALAEMQDMTHRVKELCIQALNCTLSDDDRRNIQCELDELKNSMSNIVTNTDFNTRKLLDGSMRTRKSMISKTYVRNINQPIPVDGSEINTSINIEGNLLDFSVKDDLHNHVVIKVNNDGKQIGSESIKKYNPIIWEKLGGFKRRIHC